MSDTDPITILRARLKEYAYSLLPPWNPASDQKRTALASDCHAQLPALLDELDSARFRIAELERAYDMIAPLCPTKHYTGEAVEELREAMKLRAGEAEKEAQ